MPVGWMPPPDGDPSIAILIMMTKTIGLPFVALSATAPLLQRWLASTDHPAAADPYYLYSASNLGSFASLLAYPAFIEPQLGLKMQADLWSLGWLVFATLIGGTVIVTRGLRPKSATPAESVDSPQGSKPVSWADIALWLALAFVPSSMLLSVTTYILTDLASIPLLWIVPLALYLLSFVLVFSRRPLISARVVNWIFPFLLIPVCVRLVLSMVISQNYLSYIPLHLGCFFVAALICGFELVRTKPAPGQLTLFYLVVAAGGALGGVFNGLIAPLIFNGVYEYPLGLFLVCLMRPSTSFEPLRSALPFIILAGIFAILPDFVEGRVSGQSAGLVLLAGTIGGGLCIFRCRTNRVHFSAALGAFLGVALLAQQGRSAVIEAKRNFYGVKRVFDIGPARFLMHGTTIHGAQALDPASRLIPLSYYSADTGLGLSILGIVKRKPDASIAIIGLGTGALLCHGQAETNFEIFEIDPEVSEIASDTRLFHYLSDCPSKRRIVLGDGRLAIARASGHYDEIVIDAFSSDSVPTHLLTVEALALYLDHLAPHGRIVFHLSNRYFNLLPPVINAARELKLIGASGRFDPQAVSASDGAHLPVFKNDVAAVARTKEDLADLNPADGWKPFTEAKSQAAWTDDHSDLLSTLQTNWQ